MASYIQLVSEGKNDSSSRTSAAFPTIGSNIMLIKLIDNTQESDAACHQNLPLLSTLHSTLAGIIVYYRTSIHPRARQLRTLASV